MSNKFLPDDYVPVHKRVEQFRDDFKDQYPTGDITTNIEKMSEDFVAFKAEVWIDQKSEHPVATGHGFETRKSGKSTVGDKWREKAETVAVGRALAFFGYEVEGGIASREEVESVKKSTPKTTSKTTSKNMTIESVKENVQAKEQTWDESKFVDEPSKGQLGKLNAWWNENVQGSDEDRYNFLARATGREIQSSKDLFKGEISAMIELIVNHSEGLTELAKEMIGGNDGNS